MIVCVCRDIRTSEYDSEDSLRERIMQPDFKCGLCQLAYLNPAGDSETISEESNNT